jgi:Flp pilus assembly protein TadG
MHPILRSLLAGKKADDGVAAIEFAFLVPVFAILFAGVVDVSQMLYDYYQLDQAVAAGSQYAVLNAANVTSTTGASLATAIATVVEDANGTAWTNDTVVVNDGPTVTVTNGTAASSGTAANADSYYCMTGSQMNWTWGTAYSTQTNCSGGGTAGKYVTITANYGYVPWVAIYHIFSNTTLNQSAAVRVQ